jgi:predicted DNA-binding transcriptional regulator AlpA
MTQNDLKTKIAETRTKLITELKAELAQHQIDLLLEELVKSLKKPDEADKIPTLEGIPSSFTTDGVGIFSITHPKTKKPKTPKNQKSLHRPLTQEDFAQSTNLKLISSKQLCQALDVSITWLYALIKKGTVPKPPHNKRYWAEADLPKIKEAVEKARSRPRRFRKKPLASQAFNDHSELLMDIEMVHEAETTQAKDGVLGRWAKKLRLGLD